MCNQASGDLLVVLLDVAASRRDPEKIDPKRLGRWLLKYKGRVASGLRIVKGEDSDKKIALWKVVSANPDSTGFTGFYGVSPSPSQAKSEKSHSDYSSNDGENIGISPPLTAKKYPVNPVNPVTHLEARIAELLTQGWTLDGAKRQAIKEGW